MIKRRKTNITTKDIKKLFKDKHGSVYNYNKVLYTTMHHKVIITCRNHGDFEQTPNSHYRRGDGCKKCSIERQQESQRDTTKSFIKKAISKHGNRYSYNKVIYGNNAHDKVEIICKQHGLFLMSPNSHLSRGSNCQECSRKKTGWTKTSWKNSCEGKVAKLYIIKCYNETESFYKIGITNKETLSGRFHHKSLMPYSYEVIKIIESKRDPVSIWELERSLHKVHKELTYKPRIWFSGSTECFYKILI